MRFKFFPIFIPIPYCFLGYIVIFKRFSKEGIHSKNEFVRQWDGPKVLMYILTYDWLNRQYVKTQKIQL